MSRPQLAEVAAGLQQLRPQHAAAVLQQLDRPLRAPRLDRQSGRVGGQPRERAELVLLVGTGNAAPGQQRHEPHGPLQRREGRRHVARFRRRAGPHARGAHAHVRRAGHQVGRDAQGGDRLLVVRPGSGTAVPLQQRVRPAAELVRAAGVGRREVRVRFPEHLDGLVEVAGVASPYGPRGEQRTPAAQIARTPGGAGREGLVGGAGGGHGLIEVGQVAEGEVAGGERLGQVREDHGVVLVAGPRQVPGAQQDGDGLVQVGAVLGPPVAAFEHPAEVPAGGEVLRARGRGGVEHGAVGGDGRVEVVTRSGQLEARMERGGQEVERRGTVEVALAHRAGGRAQPGDGLVQLGPAPRDGAAVGERGPQGRLAQVPRRRSGHGQFLSLPGEGDGLLQLARRARPQVALAQAAAQVEADPRPARVSPGRHLDGPAVQRDRFVQVGGTGEPRPQQQGVAEVAERVGQPGVPVGDARHGPAAVGDRLLQVVPGPVQLVAVVVGAREHVQPAGAVGRIQPGLAEQDDQLVEVLPAAERVVTVGERGAEVEHAVQPQFRGRRTCLQRRAGHGHGLRQQLGVAGHLETLREAEAQQRAAQHSGLDHLGVERDHLAQRRDGPRAVVRRPSGRGADGQPRAEDVQRDGPFGVSGRPGGDGDPHQRDVLLTRALRVAEVGFARDALAQLGDRRPVGVVPRDLVERGDDGLGERDGGLRIPAQGVGVGQRAAQEQVDARPERVVGGRDPQAVRQPVGRRRQILKIVGRLPPEGQEASQHDRHGERGGVGLVQQPQRGVHRQDRPVHLRQVVGDREGLAADAAEREEQPGPGGLLTAGRQLGVLTCGPAVEVVERVAEHVGPGAGAGAAQQVGGVDGLGEVGELARGLVPAPEEPGPRTRGPGAGRVAQPLGVREGLLGEEAVGAPVLPVGQDAGVGPG